MSPHGPSDDDTKRNLHKIVLGQEVSILSLPSKRVQDVNMLESLVKTYHEHGDLSGRTDGYPKRDILQESKK